MAKKGTATKPLYAHQNSKLAKIRVERGFSQQKLADLSGVSLSVIAKIEQQINPIESLSFARFFKLIKVLNCKFTDIVESDEILDIIKKNS